MIFILGGEGFVGSAFVRVLQRAGREFHVINRTNYESFVGRSCEVLVNANGNSKKFLAKERPKEEFQASVASVRNSLEDFRFEKYVLLSSGDVYADHSSPELTQEFCSIDVSKMSPYGFHKYLAELCVCHLASDWLIVRQGGFVGPGIKKNAVFDILYGDRLWVHPDSRFQFIGTDESARLVLELLSRGVSKEIVNLTGTGTISVREIMRLCSRALPYSEDSAPVHYEMSIAKVSKMVELPSTETSVKGFVGECNHSRIKQTC